MFPRFSVMDNLMMGAYLRPKTEIAESLQTVYDLLPKLKVRSGQLAGSLSGGEQQMLAIGRAMMGKPGCSCSTSLRSVWRRSSSMRSSPWSTGSARWERRSCSWGRTRGSRSRHSDRAYVLETGSIVLSDRADQLLESDEVRKAYFGGL